MKETIYQCQNCKNPVSEKREPCPKCGCEKRDIFVTITEQVTLYEQIGGKIKGMSDKKPRLEFKRGEDFYKKTERWNNLERIIDRSKNPALYKEIIRNKNGKIIRKVIEPLSNHQGHGSAKCKK